MSDDIRNIYVAKLGTDAKVAALEAKCRSQWFAPFALSLLPATGGKDIGMIAENSTVKFFLAGT